MPTDISNRCGRCYIAPHGILQCINRPATFEYSPDQEQPHLYQLAFCAFLSAYNRLDETSS